MHKIINIYKDYLKFKLFEKFRGGRLKSPMDFVINTLLAKDLLPKKIIALDIFGMYGLWNTKDFSNLCDYIELWEIDSTYAKYAKKFVTNANVFNGDSIKALQSKTLITKDFNFIVCDNWIGGIYGDNYCEHFDLFPEILRFKNAIIVLNLAIDTKFIKNEFHLSDDKYKIWIKRRQLFYEVDSVEKITSDRMIELYVNKVARSGLRADHEFYVPRNLGSGFIVMRIN